MLYTRLASPIFTRALARPIVRTTSPIGPFSCANTCSTAARTFDLAPFARAVCLGIGLRGGFLRWICERRPFSARSLSFAPCFPCASQSRFLGSRAVSNGLIGGCARIRTLDPLIKSQLFSLRNQGISCKTQHI